MRHWIGVCVVVGAGVWAGQAEAAVIAGQLVAQDGASIPGLPGQVEWLERPFMEGAGVAVVHGTLDNGLDFILRDGQVLWYAGDESAAVDLQSAVVSTNAAGQFLAHAMVDGASALWTADGVFAQDGVVAPGLPGGGAGAYLGQPWLDAGGGLRWMYYVTGGRYLMRSASGLPADAEVVLANGSPVGGWVVDDASDALLRYAASKDGEHVIALIEVDDGAPIASDWLWVDGQLVAGQFEPIGDGSQWFSFDDLAVDDDGRWAVGARATGSTSGVYVDGSPLVLEGDTIGDITIGGDAEVGGVDFGGPGQLAHTWTDVPGELVLATCDVDDPAGSTVVVLHTGDEIDIDGDQVGDLTVDDIPHGFLWSTSFMGTDSSLVLDIWSGPITATVKIDPVCCQGGSCCGNGIVDPAEACDDGDADAGDDCTTACTEPVCGDGFLHRGFEACDDGNGIDDDACSNACVPAPEPETSGTDSTSAGTDDAGAGSDEEGEGVGDAGDGPIDGGDADAGVGEGGTDGGDDPGADGSSAPDEGGGETGGSETGAARSGGGGCSTHGEGRAAPGLLVLVALAARRRARRAVPHSEGADATRSARRARYSASG